MKPEDLKRQFASRGYAVRWKDDEVVLQECVFCGNQKWNLEINTSRGLHFCWSCQRGGRADKLINQLLGLDVDLPVNIDKVNKRDYSTHEADILGDEIRDSPRQRKYLQTRGIPSLDAAILGIRAGKGAWVQRIAFPLNDYFTRNTVAYIGRTFSNETPKYLMDGRPDEMVGYRVDSSVHVVVEGVFDGIHVMKAGFNSAVLSGTGSKWIETWSARLTEAHDVVILLDGEATEEAQRLFWFVKPIHDRVRVCTLPPGLDPGILEPVVLRRLISAH